MVWPKAMPIVEVDWIDSSATHGWVAVDSLTESLDRPDAMLCKSAGYLFRDDAVSVVLVLGQTSEHHCDSSIQIPRCAVRSVRTLQAVPNA